MKTELRGFFRRWARFTVSWHPRPSCEVSRKKQYHLDSLLSESSKITTNRDHNEEAFTTSFGQLRVPGNSRSERGVDTRSKEKKKALYTRNFQREKPTWNLFSLFSIHLPASPFVRTVPSFILASLFQNFSPCCEEILVRRQISLTFKARYRKNLMEKEESRMKFWPYVPTWSRTDHFCIPRQVSLCFPFSFFPRSN